MSKKTLIVFVFAFALLFGSATLTHAALTTTQANAIIQLLQSFGADQSVVDNVRISLTGSTPTITSSLSCGQVNLRYNLYLGVKDNATGGDVTKLQRFLAQDQNVYPEGLITGFFGPLTEQAVQHFQAQQGITSFGSPETTGYGVVGPQTRATIRAACSDVGSITIAPEMPQFPPLPSPLPPLLRVPQCKISVSPSTIIPGETTIIKWDSIGADKATFTILDSNRIVIERVSLDLRGEDTYAEGRPGLYIFAFDFFGPGGEVTCEAVLKVVDEKSANKPPVIHSISGPANLNVGQSAIWKVQANDFENGLLTYSVRWGDELTKAVAETHIVQSQPLALYQTTTFSHSYSKVGIYHPTFTVTDNVGLKAVSSISVKVGEPAVETGSMKISVIDRTTGGHITTATVFVYYNDSLVDMADTSTGSAVFEGFPTGQYLAIAEAKGYGSEKGIFSVVANAGGGLMIIELTKTVIVVPQAGITIIAPNGGESYSIDDTLLSVKYRISGEIRSGRLVCLRVVKSSESVGDGGWCFSDTERLSAGEHAVQVSIHDETGPSFAPGKYLIYGFITEPWNRVALVSDISDGPFKLISLPVVDGKSPWGQKLVKSANDVPNGQFRAYWIKTDTLIERLPSEVTNRIYFDYGGGGKHPYGGVYGSEKLGAYWIGKFTFGGLTVGFDLSNPQWDVARLYIDGSLVNTYGGNSGTPYVTRYMSSGEHTIEIEYESKWHAGAFRARIASPVFTTPEYQSQSEISGLLAQAGDVQILGASVYESGDSNTGVVNLTLPTLSSPTVLALSSYDPVLWNITNDFNIWKSVKAVVLYSFSGAAEIQPLVGSVPVYRMRQISLQGQGTANSQELMSSLLGEAIIGSFVYQYSPTFLSIPTLAANSNQSASVIAALLQFLKQIGVDVDI